MDRRGRGGSGDDDGYAIEREFEDVASVVDSIGGPVHLLGHSYGALCSLECALLTTNVRKLVLYEPPVDVTGERINPPGVIGRMEAMLEAGDRDGVVTTLMSELAGLPPEAIEHLRSLPDWRTRLEAAHTIPREARAEEAYRFDPGRFGDLAAPTLLLLGSESPAAFEDAEKAVNEALPDSRIVVMYGQGHAAIDTGTDLFTLEVLRFLTDDVFHEKGRRGTGGARELIRARPRQTLPRQPEHIVGGALRGAGSRAKLAPPPTHDARGTP